MPKYTLKRVLV